MTDKKPTPTVRKQIPGYLLHKPSGRARVRIDGQDIYLGPFGSEKSRIAYGQIVAQYAAGLPIDPFASSDESGTTVGALVLAYLDHAQAYYRKGGKPTDEYGCIKSAVDPLVKLYGDIACNDFGPLMLKAVRQQMIDSKKKCRRYINMSIGRIRRCFRWGVENELCEPSVLQKLEAVTPLLAGRCEAVDHAPRHPVPQADLDAVMGRVKQRTKDMMALMLMTGARPGEIVSLTRAMIDRSGDVWTAKLDDHKTVHRGKVRVLDFGPRAQLILQRYLTLDPDRPQFPIRRATATAAIKKACTDLGIKRFTSHWLRHNAATRIREEFGLDAAQVVLRHATCDVTQVYAAVDRTKAQQIARDCG